MEFTTDVETEIHNAIAKAFFACAYANQYEECDNPGFSISGCDFFDVLPDVIDPAALHAADTLVMDFIRCNDALTLGDLFHRAELTHEKAIERFESASDDENRCEANDIGSKELKSEHFGHYLAMEAMGTGVGLSDAFGSLVASAFKVPSVEFGGYSLEKSYFPENDSDDE